MATTVIERLGAPHPRLPFDVQLVVAENCPDVPTLLALVSSHKTLREHGARLALHLPSARVRLHTERALYSFFHFLAPPSRGNGLPSRLTRLHTLDISFSIFRGDGIKALTTMFAHVPELSSLTIRDGEPTLANNPPLYAALQRLTTLKGLHAFSAGPETRKLFAEVASPLEDVTLTHDNVGPPLEIEKFLQRHHATLTRVCATQAVPFTRREVANAPMPVVFENVRELAIDGFVWNAAPEFFDAFPNVVNLDVGTAITAEWRMSSVLERIRGANKYISGGDVEDDSDDSDVEDSGDEEEAEAEEERDGDSEMEERDEVNRLLEMGEDHQMGEHRRVGVHGPARENDDGNVSDEDEDDDSFVWESLERVRGGLLDLYVFGNCCVVDALTIDGLIRHNWDCVPAVVADHRPRILHMSVSSSLEVDTWHWRKFASVRELCLKVVVKDLDFYEEEGLMDTVLRLVSAFTFCSSFCFNFVGPSEQSCTALNRLDHETFALGVFQKSNVSASMEVCIHTPVRATIWRPTVRVVGEEDGYVEVQPTLSEDIYL